MADELERPPPIVPDVKPTRIVLPAIDCPVHSVTVFEDRAEVTRSINVTSQVAGRGVYEVIVEGFTSKINKESVRVKGTGYIFSLSYSLLFPLSSFLFSLSTLKLLFVYVFSFPP